jgi:hypothetical protein
MKILNTCIETSVFILFPFPFLCKGTGRAQLIQGLSYVPRDRGYGVRILVQTRGFLFSITSRPDLGPTQPPIQWVPGAVSPGIKRLGLEVDHRPACSAELKNGGNTPALPHTSSRHSA